MKKIQIQALHHITIVGSTKQSAVDFWQGALGMPFVMEQPNLGNPAENHLYFDPGDGRLLTVFTNEERQDAGRPAPREVGSVDHIAFNVSRATFKEAAARLTERGVSFYERDRGFMDSLYLKDPNGLTVELACYKFQTPEGFRFAFKVPEQITCKIYPAHPRYGGGRSVDNSAPQQNLDHDRTFVPFIAVAITRPVATTR